MGLYSLLRFILSHPLNRRRPAAALADFFRWQIGSRLLGQQVAYRWIGDTRFLVARGDTGLTANIYCGLQEMEEMAYVLHVLRPGELVVDVGANVGSYTLLAGAVRRCRVASFEPAPATFRALQANVRLNGVEELVATHNAALGEGEGTVRFSQDQNCANRILTPGEDAAGIEVPVTTLDRKLGGEAPSLIKVDVEGFELAVLRGALRTLARPELNSVIMEVSSEGARYGFTLDEMFDLLRGHGFSLYRYDVFKRELAPSEFANTGQMNRIFIRDIERARQAVKASEHFRIKGTDV